jgi:hypothetical protein
MSSTLKILGGLALAGALSSSAQAQGLVTERNFSLAMAQAIANAAMEKCKDKPNPEATYSSTLAEPRIDSLSRDHRHFTVRSTP